MKMTCNLGTEKMPIILDQPEAESNPTSHRVFQTIDVSTQEHDIDSQNYVIDISSKNIRIMEPMKLNLVKNCLAKKIDEDYKKYPQPIVSSDYMYNTSELLNFNNTQNEHQKEVSVPLKIEHKKYKRKVRLKDGSDEFGLDEHINDNNSGVGDGFGNKTKDDVKKKCRTKKLNVMKKGYKLIAPHPEIQEVFIVEKAVQKFSDHISHNETVKTFDEQHLKGGNESEKCIKLHNYSNYSYTDKRQGELCIEPNLLSDFDNFNKESKVNELKNNNGYDTKMKCYKCFNCSFMSLSLESLNSHCQKKDKCFNNSETFHCPGCKNVFYSLTPLRVHLVHDHKMVQREVKLILNNIQEMCFEKMDISGEKLSCVYESEIQNGNLFVENDMGIESAGNRDGVKGGFVQLPSERGAAGGRDLEQCLTKRQTMLESYLDDISQKGDCSLPPTLTQNGSDLLENTFNFTAPVSEQLPSIQPPPAHSSSNGLIEHPHLMMNQQSSQGYVGMANVFPEHRTVEEQYKGGNHYGGDNSLMLQNGNYLPHQIHDIPVINLDENHLGKQTDNILSQEINIDDFPSYHENGLPAVDEDNGCRLSIADDDQEKKKLKKLGVGYRCDINGCKVRLQSEKNIQYHRRCHEGTLYNCPECCKDCSTWVSLSSHLWQAHKIDMELYKCDQCPYKTPSYSRLTNIHRGIHGKARPFLCDVCGKGFKTVKQMRNHKNIHKAKMVRMSVCHCDICGRTVANKRQLELHINNTHKKKKPYRCYMCGYASAVKHSLVVHMRRHTGEKPYQCEKCEYKTADHNALRRHKMKHSGVRNYKCSHCSYTCIQASTYKVHIKTKHPGLETDVIFGCGQCNFQSLNRGTFLSHTSEHENYNAQIRKQTRCQTTKQTPESGSEYYGENNKIDLVGPIISERVVETIRDLSGAQTLLEDDYYGRITSDLDNSHEMKYKNSGIT